MAGTDGSITFSTELDNAELEKGLIRLKKKILKIEDDLSQDTFKKNTLTEQLKAATAEREELQKVVSNAARSGTESGQKTLDRFLELGRLISELEAKIKKYDSAIADSNLNLDAAKNRYGELASAVGRLRDAAPLNLDPQLQEMSEKATAASQRIIDLNEQIAALQEQQANLGWAPNHGWAFGEAAKEYDDLTSQIEAINQEIISCKTYLNEIAENGDLGKLASGAEIARERINDLTQYLADLQAQQDSLGLAWGAREEYEQLSTEIERVSELLETYRKNLSALEDSGLDDFAQDAEVANRHIAELNQELAELNARQKELEQAGVGLGYQEYDQNAARIAEITRELKEYQRVLQGSGQNSENGKEPVKFIDYIALAGKKLISILSKAEGAFKAIDRAAKSALKSVGTSIASAVKKMLSLIGNMNALSKLTESLGQKFRRLGQMIRRVFVFSVITSGLRAIRKQIAASLSANAEFSTSLGRLKGVLLTAFQPVYDAVLPALITLINILSRAIAAVTEFISVLFGTTAKRAQANAKALNSQAKATAAAGSAAEEASEQMAAFDEINRLEDTSSSGGGGGAGGGDVDTGPLFDWEYDDTPFESWGEAFSAFLDKILNGIPKLREAFAGFASWLNDLSGKLYEMFTFPGVQDKVILIGQELAKAFNDLVTWIDWNQLGMALGAGLNLALQFLVNFLYTFDWLNLGRSLAALVNGMVSEIDWYAVGQLLWAGWKIAIEMLAGFLLGLDMVPIAQAASRLVMGFFNSMTETIQKIDWVQIGTQIAVFLNNIDWYGVITSVLAAIFAALTALVDLVAGLVSSLKWDKIATQIYTAINDSVGRIDWQFTGQTLGDFFIRVFEFLSTVVAGINWGQIGSDIGSFVSGINWEGIFSSAKTLMLSAVQGAIDALKGFIENSPPEVIAAIALAIASIFVGGKIKLLAAFVGLFALLQDQMAEIGGVIAEAVNKIDFASLLSGLGEMLGDALKGALNLLIGFVETLDWFSLGMELWNGLAGAVQSIDWGGIISKIFELLGAAVAGAVALVAGLAKAIWDTIVDALTSAFDYFSDKIEECGGNIIAGIFKGIADAVVGILTWLWDHLVKPIIDGIKSLFGIHSPSTVMAEIGGYLIEGLLQGIVNVWHTIVEFFSTVVGALIEFFSNAWETIKTAASIAWDAITGVFKAAWEGIKAVWDAVVGFFSGIWESIKAVFSVVADVLGGFFSAAWGAITAVWDDVVGFFSGIWDGIQGVFSAVADVLGGFFSDAWSAITGVWDSVVGFFSGVWEGIKNVFGGVADWFKNIFSAAWQAVKNVFSAGGEIFEGIKEGILAGLKAVINAIIDGINKVIAIPFNGINAALNKIKSISILGVKPFGWISTISVPQIPKLAQGAVIPPNREFLAVLGDQKSGNNIEAPESLLRQIQNEGNAQLVSLLSEILQALKEGQVIMMDGKSVTKKIVKNINGMTRASGRVVLLG